MNVSRLCDEILKVDNKIRSVSLYDEGEFHSKMQEGIMSYLTPEETEISLSQAVYRWSYRKKLAPKIGQPIYSMTKYEKINRITIPIGKAGVILVSTELNANIEEIVNKISEKLGLEETNKG